MRPSTRPSIRTVLFDVGGTLLRVRPSVGTVYAGAARDHGFEVSVEDLDRNFRAAWRRSAARGRSRGYSCSDEILRDEWYTVVCETFRDAVPAERMPALFEDLYDRFASAEAFLGSPAIGNTSCLILDIAMPGMSGADLQQELSRRRLPIPIVFITAHVDDGMRARVLEAGAIACLFKPFSDTALLSAVRAAIPSSNRRGGRANDAIPS